VLRIHAAQQQLEVLLHLLPALPLLFHLPLQLPLPLLQLRQLPVIVVVSALLLTAAASTLARLRNRVWSTGGLELLQLLLKLLPLTSQPGSLSIHVGKQGQQPLVLLQSPALR
jgi:hypothetical protein